MVVVGGVVTTTRVPGVSSLKMMKVTLWVLQVVEAVSAAVLYGTQASVPVTHDIPFQKGGLRRPESSLGL